MNQIKKITGHFLIVLMLFGVLQFVIYPSLTAASTFLNIFGLLVVFPIGVFIYFYVKTLILGAYPKETPKEFGETELDYIPKPKTKRKYTKKIKKDGFPLPPHNPKSKNQ